MARLTIRILLLLAAVSFLFAGGSLWLAHRTVDGERPPLPSRDEIMAGAAVPGGPVALSIANTASQPMPRSAVLEASQDPAPDAPYVMSHPAFVLEWADGRLLLIDLGMDREGALDFGFPIELLSGGGPIAPHGSVAELLGPAAGRVDGVVLTHLHEDHVGGLAALCALRSKPLRVFMTGAQDRILNYTTRPGRQRLSEAKLGGEGAEGAPCVDVVTLVDGGLAPVPGFPGVFVIDAGGHTPGSQIVVAHVDVGGGSVPYAFTGDIVNHVAGIDADVPKPWLYSLFVVPESTTRLAELRPWLRTLRDAGGVRLLVSHDEGQLAASGVPFLTAPARP